jgi:Domain of unknown function (DUF1858).
MTDTPLLITPETKVGDMLDCYPELLDTLISLSDRYKNLKNPILRKTVAPRTPLKVAAQMGGLEITEMINALRRAAGQPPV